MSDSNLIYDDLEHVALRARHFLCRAMFQFITAQKEYEEDNDETMAALVGALLSLAAVVAQTQFQLATKTAFLDLAGICFDSEEKEASLPEEDEDENKTA
jgi:hypothetical protein